MAKQNLFLVGLMAVGKTTIGRLLAGALALQFVDSDVEIEARAGADLGWIFDVEGEAGFRDREEHVIDDLTRREGIVLATGGGAVLRPANREALRSRGTVIHLHSTLEQLVDRTGRDTRRPLLQGQASDTRRATLEKLMNERAPLYAEVADFRFLTDKQGPKQLARHIEATLREAGVVSAKRP